MFSIIRIAAAGALAIVLVAGATLSTTSASHQAEKALRTKQELNSLVEQTVVGATAPSVASIGTDAWGGPLYLMPVCTTSRPSNGSILRNTVVLIGFSGGAAKELSAGLTAAVLNSDGTLKPSSFATACFVKEGPGGWLSGAAAALGFPALSDIPDLVELYTYADTLAMSGNSNAAASVRAAGVVDNWAPGGNPVLGVGTTDGELRFFSTEKTLYFWRASPGQWLPVQGDANSTKGLCKQGRVYVSATSYAGASVEPAFCIGIGEVFVPTRADGALDLGTSSYLAGGVASPQPFADRRVKLTNSALGGEPVHATPTLTTYNEARSFCLQMGENLMTGAQFESLQLQTGLPTFPGYQPMMSSLSGQPGSPCKGTNSGYNLCAVDPSAPLGPVSFTGTAQQRVQTFGPAGSPQYVWDLGGNLAEWIWSGPDALADNETATVLGEGLFFAYNGGALSANWLASPGMSTTSPLSKAGFRCSARPR